MSGIHSLRGQTDARVSAYIIYLRLYLLLYLIRLMSQLSRSRTIIDVTNLVKRRIFNTKW